MPISPDRYPPNTRSCSAHRPAHDPACNLANGLSRWSGRGGRKPPFALPPCTPASTRRRQFHCSRFIRRSSPCTPGMPTLCRPPDSSSKEPTPPCILAADADIPSRERIAASTQCTSPVADTLLCLRRHSAWLSSPVAPLEGVLLATRQPRGKFLEVQVIPGVGAHRHLHKVVGAVAASLRQVPRPIPGATMAKSVPNPSKVRQRKIGSSDHRNCP